MAELPPDIEVPASFLSDPSVAQQRLLIAQTIPVGDAHVASDFTEKGRAEYIKRSSRVLSDTDETFTLGQTIKLEEQMNEQELLRSAANTFTNIIFNSAIVQHALQQDGSNLHADVANTMSPMLRRTSLCMERARSPHLTLEMRTACAVTAGDEAVNLLLGTPSRSVKSHAELAGFGAHFLRTLSHMLAHGIFMRERILLQAKSEGYRLQAFEDPPNYWGLNGKGVNENFQGVEKGLYMRTNDLFHKAYSYVETAIRVERQERMNEYFSSKTKAKETHLTAPEVMPSASQQNGVVPAFSQVAQIKRALHTCFRGCLQYMEWDASLGGLKTAEVLSDFGLLASEPGGFKISREYIKTAAEIVEGHLASVKLALFDDSTKYNKFLKYLTLAEHRNGNDSRFHRRLNFWADVFWILFTSPLMLSDPQKQDEKTLQETRPAVIEDDELKKFYKFANPDEIRSYRKNLKKLCDCIVELGNLSDLVMQLSCLYICMEYSFRSVDSGFLKMCQVAAEQRNHNARVIRDNEERARLVSQTLLTKFGPIIEHKDRIANMIASGTGVPGITFPISAKLTDEQKQEFLNIIRAVSDNPVQVLPCIQQQCINKVADNTVASAAQMRATIMYEQMTSEADFSVNLNVFKAGYCSGWVKRLPLEVFFWPNMVERKLPVEICTALHNANPTEGSK